MGAPKGFNDGNLPHGSLRVTLPSGVECIAEDFTPDEDMSEKDRSDDKSKPNGALYTPNKIKATMTLQLPTEFVDIPERTTTMILDYRNENKMFMIKRVGIPRKQDDILKLPLEVVEVLNPTNFSTF